MATTMTQTEMRRTAQALWTLIEPQPQEVKDYLVRVITSPIAPKRECTKTAADEASLRLKALRGCLKDIPMEAFADDERAQYILSK